MSDEAITPEPVTPELMTALQAKRFYNDAVNADEVLPPEGVEETLDNTHRPWHRQDGESVMYYRYFKLYCHQIIPEGEENKRNRKRNGRSVKRVAQHLRMVEQHIHNIAHRWQWAKRAEAYDQHLIDIETEEVELARRANARKWEERREIQREREWQLAEQLIERGQAMMMHPLVQEVIEEEIKRLTPEGVLLQNIIRIEPAKWSMGDAARFFELASKFARLAAGMDTERKLLKINVAQMSDEELEQIAQGDT